MPPANILLLELNETNRRLLEVAAEQLGLANVRRLVGMNVIGTHTDDVLETDYLEPWVQWVSIHTGVPSSVHQIKHLGDVRHLRCKQVWERLSEAGVTSGIWGVMNGERRSAELCLFFVADPWTFDAPVYPHSLSGMTQLAVYIAKNYLKLNWWLCLCYGLNYLKTLLANVPFAELLQAVAIFFRGLIKFGPGNLVLGAFYEFTAAMAFIQARRKFAPQFSILFVNLLAHLQHHYWYSAESISPQLAYGFEVVDRLLGKLFASLRSNDILLVANGLSQQNTRHEPDWVLYRPIDPSVMLANLGVNYERLEALMTHDAHVFFSSKEGRDQAAAQLESAHVKGSKLFLVERDLQEATKLFYRLVFTDPADSLDTVCCGAAEIPFGKLFKNVVTRTGKHCQEGFVYQSQAFMADQCVNHRICEYILDHFGIKISREAVASIEKTQKDGLACL